MARKCGECRRYHTNRYHESICGLTGKNVGFLWEAKEDCFEAIALPETPAEENKGLTSDDKKSTPNDNKMAQDANKMENTPRLKVCKECGRELPIESFQIIGRHKAVNSICKECQHKKAAATRERNAKAEEDKLLKSIFGDEAVKAAIKEAEEKARTTDPIQDAILEKLIKNDARLDDQGNIKAHITFEQFMEALYKSDLVMYEDGTITMPLGKIQDSELVAELRSRGWEVRCTKVIEL